MDVLTREEARELLARRLGRRRVDAGPAAIDALIDGCCRLPLALAIVAARVAKANTGRYAASVHAHPHPLALLDRTHHLRPDPTLPRPDHRDRVAQPRAVYPSRR